MKKNNRRNFLKAGAMLGGALYMSSASAPAEAGAGDAPEKEKRKVPAT